MNNQYYYNPQYNNVADADFEKKLMYQQKIYEGKKRQLKEIRELGFLLGGAILCYLFLQTMGVFLLHIFNLYDLYKSSALFQNAFFILFGEIISVLTPYYVMSKISKKNYSTPLIPNKKVGARIAILWVLFGLGVCMIANYLTAVMTMLVKSNTSYELTQGDMVKSKSLIEFIFEFITIGVIPAICEEVALRGCALGALRKYGKGFAVFAVSVVFGLMHGNVIQFVFAFLVGMVLGYIAIKTDNIIICMFVHGINNSLSAIQDVFKHYGGNSMATTATVVTQIGLFSLGILSGICLLATKQFRIKKAPENVFDNSFGKKVAALIPGLILPFLILIYITAQTVVKTSA